MAHEIVQVISPFPPAPNSATDSAPTFNVKANDFVKHQADVYTGEVNQWATEANALKTEINSIVATIPNGQIDDATPSATNTYSSNKIEADYKIINGTASGCEFVKYPDGTMIASGTTVGAGTGTTKQNVFGSSSGSTELKEADHVTGVTFISNPKVILSLNTPDQLNAYVSYITTTQFKVSQHTKSGTIFADTKINFIAIGRWK